MRRIRNSSAIVLVTFLAALALGAADVKYIQPQDVDVSSFLSGPPADDSADHQAEIATLKHWQDKRTADDVQRCKREVDSDAFIFADVLGDWFVARHLPITADLFARITADVKPIVTIGKKKWNRVRPYNAIDALHPCVPVEDTASYPSGHATRGIVWATILSEMFPEHREELMARGRQFGDDRVIAGLHWPSDVEAGQKLGAEIARKLLDNPDFKSELMRAKDECLVGAH